METTTETIEGPENDSSESNSDAKQVPTRRPRKALPARKVSSQKQFEVLRAFAVASTHLRNAVPIQDVADALQIHPNSVSICNPFFVDVGFVAKQGHKFVPVPEVLSYAERIQWDDKNAGHKLAPLLKGTWFAEALLRRAALRPVPEEEAVSLFAELSGASPEYRTQLVMLLDFLEFSGLISRDNGVIKLGVVSAVAPKDSNTHKDIQHDDGSRGNQLEKPKIDLPVEDNFESFQIPIPGKQSAKITIPKGLSDKDWMMLKIMIDAYITRLKEEQSS